MNLYIIKIEEKYFKNLLRYHIKIVKIRKKDNYYYLYLDYDNYQKISKLKKIYNFELVDYQGYIKYKLLFKKYFLFLIIFFLGLNLIIFLSNIIFEIDIKTNDLELQELVLEELDKYNIKKYKFVKNYQEKEKIKELILENNKDKLEWLEITRIGSCYVINLEKRIINNFDLDNKPRDIVASKNAILMEIKAKSGSIIKKLNDYVKKGEVVVTGRITHKDEVVDLVKADAIIYGETWYTVHVSYPIAYYDKTYTGKAKKRISLTIFNKKINFFNRDNYLEEEIQEKKILYHKFLPLKFSYEKVLEIEKIDSIYTPEEAYVKAFNLAREKMIKALAEDSKILDQKKLKFIINDSTIDMDVFFKVYENITSYQSIEEIMGE